MTDTRLTAEGYAFRTHLAEHGIEVTPDQLADAVIEADERIRPGPDGCCVACGQREDRDFRFGLCDQCAFEAAP